MSLLIIEQLFVFSQSPHINDIFEEFPSLPRKPDLVIIKTDALQRNFVRGLTNLGCQSVVSVADTHHLHRPIEAVQQYLDHEIDLISFENDRHHLKWFNYLEQNDWLGIPTSFSAQ